MSAYRELINSSWLVMHRFIVCVRELVLEDARSLTRCLPGPRADHGKGAAAFLFSPKTDPRRRRITRKHRT